MKFNRMTLGYILAISGGIFWAVGGICGETLFTEHGGTSNWLVPIRLFISGVIVLLWAALSGQKIFKIFKPEHLKANLPTLLVFSLLGSALCQYGYYTSIQYSNAAFGTVMSYTSPVFIMLWNMFRTKRLPFFYEAVSVAFVVIGSVFTATHGDLTQLAVAPQALFWGVVAAICFAFYTLAPQKLMFQYGVLTITGWGMCLGGAVMLAIFRPWTIPGVHMNMEGLLLLLAVIFFGTVFSFTLFQSGCVIIGGLAGSILSSVEPVCSVILSVLLLHHSFAGMDFLGFFFILVTIPIVAFGQRRRMRKATIKSA